MFVVQLYTVQSTEQEVYSIRFFVGAKLDTEYITLHTILYSTERSVLDRTRQERTVQKKSIIYY